MFEFHGWANIKLTPADIEITNEQKALASVVGAIRAHLKSLDWPSGVQAVSAANGEYHLAVSGFRNRKDEVAHEAIGLFEYVSRVAPGSYGLLYVFDSDDPQGSANSFQVFVLVRGMIKQFRDTYLSPYIPTVEDES